jgi:hypothetical protein
MTCTAFALIASAMATASADQRTNHADEPFRRIAARSPNGGATSTPIPRLLFDTHRTAALVAEKLRPVRL